MPNSDHLVYEFLLLAHLLDLDGYTGESTGESLGATQKAHLSQPNYLLTVRQTPIAALTALT